MKGRSGLLVALVIAVVMTAMVWTVPKDRILASSGRSLAVTASQAAVYSQVYVKTDEDRITASRLGTVVEDYGTFVLIESRSSDELSSRVKSFATNLEVKQLDTSLNLRSYRYEPTKFDPTSRFEVAGGYKAVADVTGDYYLVQFIGPVTDEWLGEVKQAGGEIIQYVPNQAFLIHADASAADKIKSSRHVRWMGTYQAAHKLSKELMWAFGDEQKADPDNSLGNYGKTAAAEYEVAVFSRANKEDLLSQLKRVNAEVSKTITLPNSFFNIVRVKLDPAAVKVVAAMKDVLAIDPYIAPSNATEKGRLSDFAIELLTSSIATSHISSSTNEGSYDLLAAQYDSFVQDSSESASLEPLTIILSTNRMLSRPAAAKNILTVGSLQAQSADGRSRPELLGSLTEAVDAAKEFTSFWRNNNGGRIPSPALVKAALINSTTEGEAVSASNVVNSTTSTDYIDQTEALTKPGQSYSFSATVADSSKPVKVTLAWTDPAALVDPALVNNLDLEVMVDGQTYKGNVLREGVSVLGGRADSTNNVETVVLPAGISGNVTINVVATSLNGDGILGNQDTTDQHFALAVSNIRPEVGEVITAAGSTLVMEGCPPNNNAIDPGERVTVSFALQNTGTGNATDVVATLQTTGGVTMPSGPQNYGTLVAGGPAVSRNFTFVVDPSVVCGGTVTATLNLGALGSVNFTLTTGTTATVTTTFRNTARINVPGTGTIGNAAPYPSNISVSGVTGTISKVTVKLNTFNHTFPDDTDILLVSPTGQKVVIFSDVGGGTDAVNLTFTLDDAAAAALPDAGPLVSGTFRPTNIGATDTFAAPAPAPPYGSTLSTFNGQNPNGTWNLYIVDDTSGDAGSFNGGWELNISTTARVCTTPCINTPALSINNATVTEGNSGTVNAVFTVSISNASPMPVTVMFATANGTATAGSDYTATTGTLTFPANSTASQTISVPVIGDNVFELDETFTVTLSNPTNAVIAQGTGTGTITNDDPIPSLSINNATVTEGNSGTVNAVFTVSISNPSFQPVTVMFATANGTATAGSDYTATTGTLTFPANSTASQTISVPVIGDMIVEPDETFTVTLSNPTNATIAQGTGTGTITNDDAVTLSINNATVTEGNSGTVNAVFTVSISGTSTQPVTVDFATADGTATAGSDYTATTGTLTFPANSTAAQTISVPVIGDLLVEPDETFTVTLSNPTNATIAQGTGTGTITNDDAAVLSINNATVTEGNSGTVNAVFMVSLSNPSVQPITVMFATANGTAMAGSDYTATTGTLTFPANSTASQTISVPVIGDLIFELDETFTVTLSNPTNATIATGQGTGTGTITNDDPMPTLSINNATVTEGNSGTVNANFMVSISNPSFQPITVMFATANGTATAGSDYTSTTGTLTFPANSTAAQTISVPVIGDLLVEPDETFTVTLSNPTNATIAQGTGTGTITNDDVVMLSINSATVTEGNSGTVNAVFTVSISNASFQPVTVDFATANGTAMAGSDYTSTTGTLTFPANSTASQTISVPVIGDNVFELDETFLVNLTNPVNAVIATGQGTGTGTITNDDPMPMISINSATVIEGNSGTVNAVFTVSLSNPSFQPITVMFATADGTAMAGSDYTAATGTLTFAPGSTSQPINVPVIGDLVFELDETFTVTLSNPTNATIATGQGTGTGTITNDDPIPMISINNTSVTEGNSGTVNAVFTVSLSNPSFQPITVMFATANGTAMAGSDYTSTTGTLTFAPGSTSQPINVPVIGDLVFELDETFTVTLSNPTNATIATGQGTGTGTITNDDQMPSLSINNATVTEGNSGTVNAVFTVSISNASFQPVTVMFATANGTATAGSDYTATTGTLTFPANSTASQTISVPVIGDLLVEPNETFLVNLSNPTNATIATGQGTGTITNDDVATLSINNATVTEGNTGTVNAVFMVSLSNPSAQPITVMFATADGTATAGSDYTATTGTLTFPANSTAAQTISVPVIGDNVFEPNETFVVNLSNAINAMIAAGQGTGTITNDDPMPAISINDVSVPEGNTGTSIATFMVTLSNPSVQPITVMFATADRTATAGTDYVATSGTLTFAPGMVSQPITVTINGDTIFEQSETFFVNLANPTNSTILDGQGLGTIANDDQDPGATANTTIYVADTNNNRIQRSTDNGVTWFAIGLGAGSAPGRFNAPEGVAASSDDMAIFVADTGNNRIQRSTDGGVTWQVLSTTSVGGLGNAQDLTYDQVNDRLLVADTGKNRILVATGARMTTTPTFSAFAGVGGSGTAPGRFSAPAGIAVSSTGVVYVADSGNNRIQVNSNGQATGWSIFAQGGTTVGSFTNPSSIFVDQFNNIAVADTGNSRIQLLRSSTMTWEVFFASTSGTQVGSVRSPEGVKISGTGDVFVSDTLNNRIQKRPLAGGAASVVASSGNAVGSFNRPTGIR